MSLADKPILRKLLAEMALYKHTPIGPPGTSQGHSGDVLQHSLWTALQCVQWAATDCAPGLDDLVEPDMVMPRVVVAALLHDVGKAADCFTDVYDPRKYASLPSRVHPNWSGSLIMGWIPFRVDCKNPWNKNISHTLDLSIVLQELHVVQWRNEIALLAFMHWEFGEINIRIATGMKPTEAYHLYMDQFLKFCRLLQIPPALTLIKECILVSAADIAAGRFPRVGLTRKKSPICRRCRLKVIDWLCDFITSQPNSIKPVYPGTDPFHLFKVDKTLLATRRSLLDYAAQTLKQIYEPE